MICIPRKTLFTDISCCKSLCMVSNEIDYLQFLHTMWHLIRKNNSLHYVKTKVKTSFMVTAKLISTFVFATQIAQSFFFLIPKFQASSLLVCLHRPVCVVPSMETHTAKACMLFMCVNEFFNG